MNKTYGRINWENYPSDETPLNESNLNKIDVATDEIDNRVITLDTTKATKEEVSTLVQDVAFEEKTGIITIVKKNGSKVTIDTQMEKIAVNFSYNAGTQQIILTLIDGTKQYIDLTALITQYEFLDSDTVAFSIDSTGKVSAIVKEASIQEKHLQPNYLADIKVEVAKAQASQSAAAKSESNAKASETAAATSESNAAASATKAQSYATGGTNSRTGEDTDNAKYYSQQSAQSQSAASTSADTANTKAKEAAASAATAKTSADNAAGSANIANEKANSAANSATIAVSNSNAAQQYASNAAASADTAQNYAVADTDSAKYYYEQAKQISESFSGALRPMGTVTFANLPALSATTSGNMYNISDQFTTTSDFKEGAGNTIPAGANVYKTEDGKWDVLAGTPVTGVKGSAESEYRRGNVNITAENVGAIPVDGNAGSATTVQDYNDTSKKIKVGWVGSALNEDQILAVACYSGGDDDTVKAKIKDVSKDTFKSWLGEVLAANRATALTSSAGSATQPVYFSGGKPVACTYTLGKSVPSNAVFTDTNTWRGIQNNLTSTSTTDSLSANQGKVLKELVDSKSSSGHTHNYAGSDSAGGAATSANKLNTNAGNIEQPIYFKNGVPVKCGHSLGTDVPERAVFTDTTGSFKSVTASGNGDTANWKVITLANGYKIITGKTTGANYTMNNQYGNAYWAAFSISVPNGIDYFDCVNVTPYAGTGLVGVVVTYYTKNKISGFVFSPQSETKNITFHVTIHGTA